MSSNVEEATINPDGSAAFETPVDATTTPEDDTEPNFDEDVPFEEAAAEAVEKGTDPAIFLALGFVLFVLVYFYFHRKGKKKTNGKRIFLF
jgi:hypothetical protein